jgi:hypothetical protein
VRLYEPSFLQHFPTTDSSRFNLVHILPFARSFTIRSSDQLSSALSACDDRLMAFFKSRWPEM